jgi:hypothetical protein
MTIRKELLAAACLLLAACGPTWVNPNLSGAEAERIRQEDTAFCQARVDSVYPLPEGVDSYGPPPSQSELQYNQQIARPGYLSGYRDDYDVSDKREQLFNKCMTERGWQQR